MPGQLVFYWAEEKGLAHFLSNMVDFADVLLVVSPKLKRARLLSLKLARAVQIMSFEEFKLMLAPDVTFHYSDFGEKPDYAAAKLKQGYVVAVLFGVEDGIPLALGKKLKPHVAAPLLAYEIKRALGEIRF